jgi:NADP-dependent 3-hydroxy acid dehydrogenase YdfG
MPEALIWGASGGIGSALAARLRDAGWRVYAAARSEAKVPPGLAAVHSFDASDPFSCDAVAHATAQIMDAGLDLMVYAAGVMRASTADQTDAAAWRAVLDANLNGAHLAARASLPLMKEGGHVVLLGAYVQAISLPRFGAYAAAKAALEPLATILQKENRKLKVTLVRPPAVDTAFWANVPFKLPSGALTPAQVAEAILARWTSGEAGPLDL